MKPSPTTGMGLAQRILHVGGRNNAAGYVEFGSTQAVEALVHQVLRDREIVAWRTFNGEGGFDYRSYEDNENYKEAWELRNPNHKGWVEAIYL